MHFHTDSGAVAGRKRKRQAAQNRKNTPGKVAL